MRISKKSSFALAALCSGALALAACDSGQDNLAEERADEIRDRADAQADVLENQADRLDNRLDGVGTPAEQRLEDQAERIRKEAEAKADAIENHPDTVAP